MLFPNETQSPQDVANHYDELDPFYRKFWGEHLHHGLWESGRESHDEAVITLLNLVADAAKISSNSTVCDIGCGYGATARMLVQTRHAAVTGITLSSVQYQYAKSHSKSTENPSYILGNWLRNNLPNASFDAALSIESSEHMPDKEKFFSEAFRILKPKGRLVICAWLAKEKANDWEIRHLLEPICREGRLPSIGTENDYCRMIEQAGFKLVSFHDLSSSVKKTWSLCCWRTFKGLFTFRPIWRFLFKSSSKNRSFIKSVFRIKLAYALGSMRYGMFVIEKP